MQCGMFYPLFLSGILKYLKKECLPISNWKCSRTPLWRHERTEYFVSL